MMKRTLSLVLASTLLLSTAVVPQVSAVDILPDVGETLHLQHSETLSTEYQAGYFEYVEIISPQYEDGKRFSESDALVAVKLDGKWGYINPENQVVVPFAYDFAGIFNEGHALVGTSTSGGYTMGMVDTFGNYTAIYKEEVSYSSSTWSKTGNYNPLVVPSAALDDNNTLFHNGLCTQLYFTVSSKKVGVIIDKQGNGIAVPEYLLTPYNEGVIVGNATSGTNAKVFDSRGNELLNMGSYSAYSINQGLIPVYSSNKLGFYNYHTQSFAISPTYSSFSRLDVATVNQCFCTAGYAAVKSGSYYGGVDMTGKTVIPFSYSTLFQMSEGRASFEKSGKWGYLDENYEVVIPATFSRGTRFYGGKAAVKDGTSYYLIDTKGNKIEGSDQLDGSLYFIDSNSTTPPRDYVTVVSDKKTGFGKVVFNPELPVAGDTSDWALEKVIAAIQAELVPANQQNTYRSNVTRQDFAYLALISMAARANMTVEEYVVAKTGKTLTQLVNNYPFNDTNNSYVVAAEAIGIVSGRDVATFDPYASITRQEVAVILTGMSRVTGDSTGNPPVADVVDRDSIATWALPSVDYVISADIMGTMGSNDFSPTGNCTREQTFTIMYNYYASILG